jgi:uncharacterized protein YeaO (DUF488 family)
MSCQHDRQTLAVARAAGGQQPIRRLPTAGNHRWRPLNRRGGLRLGYDVTTVVVGSAGVVSCVCGKAFAVSDHDGEPDLENTAVNTRRVRVARAYDEPTGRDGTRVLVDRLWPRGLAKANARFDEWCKQIAPSTELRRWYGHDPARFPEFRRRYRGELAGTEQTAALAHLRELARHRPLTLLTASKDVEISQAAVLAEFIEGH